MAKNKEQPYASYTVRFYEGRVEASMQNFDKLTHAKIQNSYPFIHEEWGRQHQAAMLDITRANKEKELADG